MLAEVKCTLGAAGSCVVPLLGITVHSGKPCIVMPLYESSAQDLIEENFPDGLPLPMALHIGADAARALLHIHSSGIIHMDVKPLNIYLNGNGNDSPLRDVVLADFGLSFFAQDAPSSAAGTTSYMSPEHWDTKTFGMPGPKADVWGLGTTLLNLLTGTAPHYGLSREGAQRPLMNTAVLC